MEPLELLLTQKELLDAVFQWLCSNRTIPPNNWDMMLAVGQDHAKVVLTPKGVR